MKKFLTILFCIFIQFIYSQFCGTSQNQGTISANPSNQLTPIINTGRPYWTFSATAGCTYTFETCGLSSIDTELEILSASPLSAIVYNDDACGLRSRIVWTASSSGNYHILLTRYNFGTCRVINSATQIRYSSTCGSGLPIELYSFTGEHDENINYLNWVTLSERNNSHFIIERTTDFIDWYKVDSIKGLGNSSTGMMYETIDINYKNDINYYRLTQYDYDGKYEIFNDKIIAIDNRKSKTIVKIYNILGQEVNINTKGIIIILYSDNTMQKIFNN